MTPTTSTHNQLSRRLERAAALIERGWCQGYYANDRRGERVGWLNEKAVAFCMEGAVMRACGDQFDEAYPFLIRVLPRPPVGKRGNPIAYWNDRPRRKKLEVVAKLREAAQLARLAK